MGGTTTPLAFPYPTGTDRVMDGDNAMQALAEKIDDYLAGASNAFPGGVARRRGGTVHVELNHIVGGTTAAGGVLAVLPAGYFPAANGYFYGINFTTGAPAPVYVLATGNIVAGAAYTAGHQLVGTFSYAVAGGGATALPALDDDEDDDADATG